MLGGWLEAGGTIDGFWRSTPRLIAIAAKAYRRRRGWLAWHTAVLGRAEYENGFPALEQLTGDADDAAPGQSDEAMLHNGRLWAAALEKMDGDRMEGDA